MSNWPLVWNFSLCNWPLITPRQRILTLAHQSLASVLVDLHTKRKRWQINFSLSGFFFFAKLNKPIKCCSVTKTDKLWPTRHMCEFVDPCGCGGHKNCYSSSNAAAEAEEVPLNRVLCLLSRFGATKFNYYIKRTATYSCFRNMNLIPFSSVYQQWQGNKNLIWFAKNNSWSVDAW